MKKYILMSAIGLATVVGLSSCSDYLDSKNKSTVTADQQFDNATGWAQLLNQAYYNMRAIYDDPTLFCAGTDLYTTSQGNSPSVIATYQYGADNSTVTSLYTNCYAAINIANCVLKYSTNETYNAEARFIRDYCYYILTQQFGGVPYIEEYIESAETSYPRSSLQTVYEGIISDLESLVNNSALPQVSDGSDGHGHATILAAKALLAKVYLAAGWDLQTTLSDATSGTYSVNSTDFFAKAAAMAAQVASAVPLTQNFETKWDFDVNEQGKNPETLFAIQYDRATSSNQSNGGHSQQHYFGGYMGSNTLGVKALKNDLCPTERYYYAYDKGDERFESSIMTIIFGYDGNESNWSKEGYWGFFNTTAAEKDKLAISWKFFPWYVDEADVQAYMTANNDKFITNTDVYKSTTKVIIVRENLKYWDYAKGGAESTMSFENALKSIGYLPPVRKFDDKNTVSTVAQSGGDYRDVVILNASEIYLTAAEAYLMAGDETNALKYLNEVRNRAKAGNLASLDDYQRFDWSLNETGDYVKVGSTDSYNITINKLDVILDERMRETVGEYYRWMDLRRTKQLVRYNIAYCGATVTSMSGNDGQIKWLRPIPSNEIQINTGMTEADQNPGFTVEGEN